MISSSLPNPGFPEDPRSITIIDARIETDRLGEGRLDHTLTLDATRAGAHLWTKTVTFAVDAPFDVPDLGTVDPFVIAAVFPAMEVGGILRVHGRVSRVLMRNLIDYQSAWALAGPNVCRPFSLEVAEIDDRPLPSDGPDARAILAFTGGLDSMLALTRNIGGDAGQTRLDIGATMVVHGLQTGHENAAGPASMIEDLRQISDRRGLPLAVVNTNIAEVLGRPQLSYGTWLCSCLSLFGSAFDVGLLGSSVELYAPGQEISASHPLLDRLLSGVQMTIRNDEGFYRSVEKAGLLARYPEAIEDLRVCPRYYENNRNCCRCEKCITTMLSFVASGNPVPSVFADGLRLKDIGIAMAEQDALDWAPKILAAAAETGMSDDPAIKTLGKHYRVKLAKQATKDWLTKITTGRKPHRWHVFDRVGSNGQHGP
jgi:hypothetical protein